MRRSVTLPALALTVSLAACASMPAPAPAPDHIGERRIVTGTVGTLESGNWIFARIRIPGQPSDGGFIPASDSIAPFLVANRGRIVTAELAFVSAGFDNFHMILGVRNEQGTAEQWWQGLSPAERRRAQCRVRAQVQWAWPC